MNYWTAREVAEHCGWSSSATARKELRRWGVNPATDEHGHVLRHPETDAKLYHPDDIEAARRAAPGRGRRRSTEV